MGASSDLRTPIYILGTWLINANLAGDQALPIVGRGGRPVYAFRTSMWHSSISLTAVTGAVYAGAGKTNIITAVAGLSALTGLLVGTGSRTAQTVQSPALWDQDTFFWSNTVLQGAAATFKLAVLFEALENPS